MKKTSIVLMTVATFLIVLFLALAGSAQDNNEMQQPTANKEVGSKTISYEDMQQAYASEITASAKYESYSKKAEAEGYPQIAMLFKATSTAEMVHAINHKAVLEEQGQPVPYIMPEFMVKSTVENLNDALGGESYEITNIYPAFMSNADEGGDQMALVSLVYAYKTELKHKVFYEKALAALKSNDVQSLPMVYYVCPTCGNTYDTMPPQRCAISLTSTEKFVTIDDLTL
ncbi:MAG: hypothetical protein IPP15_23510 [Saprospiraceae bacterium]|uniref:Ferritin-like diiron domain-containing protein n=1 Tax=Candidatus Opimibacter skivensis TaxID=2982028 RepID=A0A9D7XSR0_9BACT|nr:hypothetical protein [Candidatus Opimibacter skivensis]